MRGGRFIDDRFKPKVQEEQLQIRSTSTQDFFDNKLDHFSNDTTTWKQVIVGFDSLI